MSEERKKVLEMLADGKITVDDAERLLSALGESDRTSAPQRKNTIDFDGLESSIRSGVEGVRRTVRASMPHLRTAIRDASPDVERIVGEATASIPGFIEEMTRTIRDTFGQSREPDEERFPAKFERDFTEDATIEPGAQLALHNPRGTIEVITSDGNGNGVRAEVHLTVHSLDDDSARAAAESVQLTQEPGPDRLVLRPVFPRGREDATYRLDIRLFVAKNLRLDLHTTHGDLLLPEMASDLVLGGDHGQLRLAGTSGNASVQHNHGKVEVGRVAGTFSLNAHHSSLELDEAVQETSINSHHGSVRVRRIGGNLVINSHHGALDADEIHGNAVANSHHGPLTLQQVAGDLTVNSHHGPVDVRQVGGSLRLSSEHAPVTVENISGELSAQSNHGPLSFGAVGKSAVIRCTHGAVVIGPVNGEVTVESDRGPVHIRGAGGRATVRASRGDVRIENPAGEVLAENNRASIEILSSDPVHSAYTLSNNRGNISVALPEGSNVRVQGFVRRGQVETNLPLEVSANGQQGQVVSGELGAGGASLQAEVESGTLTLRRA